MDRRIFGLENEYAIAFTLAGVPQVPVADVADVLFRSRFVPKWEHRSVFLQNGGRFYIDHGDHPEYATAECDSVPQLIAQDKAGERLLDELSIAAEEGLRADGSAGDLYVLKNNADALGNTYGTHENYLVPRGCDFGRLTEVLLPFLVTRQMIAGSGTVLHTGRGPRYCFSQRAVHMQSTVGLPTTHDRAMITKKDEPHGDKEQYRRLHIILGDANMSEPSLLLKAGATDLVLRMIEDGFPIPDLRLRAPVSAVKDITSDLTGCTSLLLADGSRLSALGVQEAYLQAARRYARARNLDRSDDVVARVLQLWDATLTAIGQRDFSTIDRDVDWAIKLRMIGKYRERHGMALGSPRVAQLDLGYHDVRPARGLYYRMQERGMVNRVIGDADIREAVVRPPQSTRARLRGEFVRWANSAGHEVTTDWARLGVDGMCDGPVQCLDPFGARDRRVADMMRAVGTLRRAAG